MGKVTRQDPFSGTASETHHLPGWTALAVDRLSTCGPGGLCFNDDLALMNDAGYYGFEDGNASLDGRVFFSLLVLGSSRV